MSDSLANDMTQEETDKTTLLNATVQHMAQGVAVFNRDQELVAFNPQFGELLDCPPGFLKVGMSRKEILRYRAQRGDFGDGPQSAAVKSRMALAESRVSSERTLANGRTILHERTAMPDGGFVATYTDITERNRTNRALAAQAVLLQATFQAMSQGVAVFDSDLKLAAFNPQFAEILDYPPDFLRIGMDRTELMLFRAGRGELGEGDKGALARAKVEDSLTPRRTERTLDNGRTYIYERTPLPEGGLISTVTDITDRKRARDELARQSRLLQATVESMAQGFTVFDDDFSLLLFNEHYASLFGFPPVSCGSECIGRN